MFLEHLFLEQLFLEQLLLEHNLGPKSHKSVQKCKISLRKGVLPPCIPRQGASPLEPPLLVNNLGPPGPLFLLLDPPLPLGQWGGGLFECKSWYRTCSKIFVMIFTLMV